MCVKIRDLDLFPPGKRKGVYSPNNNHKKPETPYGLPFCCVFVGIKQTSKQASKQTSNNNRIWFSFLSFLGVNLRRAHSQSARWVRLWQHRRTAPGGGGPPGGGVCRADPLEDPPGRPRGSQRFSCGLLFEWGGVLWLVVVLLSFLGGGSVCGFLVRAVVCVCFVRFRGLDLVVLGLGEG